MKLPLELEHLIKSTSGLAGAGLNKHLSTIEERKALDLEHYLRACAIRLDLSGESKCNAAAGAFRYDGV